LEDGEDLQELSERARDKKDRRSTSKFTKDTDISARGTPASDDTRNRKNNKKGKTKSGDYETSLPAGSKRKRGTKSSSVTPSIADDEDEDHDQVRAPSGLQCSCLMMAHSKRNDAKKAPSTVGLMCPQLCEKE
jgi:ATP-dependent helicase STH1/SNF2